MQKILTISTFLLLGLFIHWLPNFGVPLHSDVTWIFRLQTIQNSKLQQSIPEALKTVGAYRQSFPSFFIQWHQYTGRLNFLDLASMRFFALVADGNADLWRLFYILILSISVWLFYLICRLLNISFPVAFFLSLTLFFAPLDIWTDHKTAEPKALLFLLLTIYVTLRAKNRHGLFLASASFMASVLFKETFIVFGILIPTLFITKKEKNTKKDYWLKTFLPQFTPFIIGILFIAGFVIFMEKNFPTISGGYTVTSNNQRPSLLEFSANYFKLLQSGLVHPTVRVLLIIFLILSVITMHMGGNFKFPKLKTLLPSKRMTVFLLCCVLSLILHAIIYYFSKGIIVVRYIVPANVIFALIIGIISVPVYNNFIFPFIVNSRIVWRALFMIFVALYLAKLLDRVVIPYSIHNRADQFAWQSLIHEVAVKAPRNALVSLIFDEPYMIETAQSLEANTLLLGRYDLNYYLVFEDLSALKSDTGFLKYLVESFNQQRNRVPTDGKENILYVKADRKGGRNEYSAYLNYQLSLNHPF